MKKMFEELETLEMKEKRKRGGLDAYIGEFLYNFIRKNNIKKIVETGISWGFSSYYFLAALPSDGELISIEKEVRWKDLIIPMGWNHKWKVVEGMSREKLAEVFKKNKNVDLFWHDSDHSYKNQSFEYQTAFPYVRYLGSHDIYRRKKHAWDVFVKKSNLKIIIQDEIFGLGKVK